MRVSIPKYGMSCMIVGIKMGMRYVICNMQRSLSYSFEGVRRSV